MASSTALGPRSGVLPKQQWRSRNRGDAGTPAHAEGAPAADETGGPILMAGSRTLVHSLLEVELVDELNLQVFPLLLGSGMRLFPETIAKTALELVSSAALSNGVLLQTYKPAA